MAFIKLRAEDGRVFAVKNIAFVELQTEDGSLAGVISVDEKTKRIRVYYPGDAAFHRYAKLFSKEESKMVVLQSNTGSTKSSKQEKEA